MNVPATGIIHTGPGSLMRRGGEATNRNASSRTAARTGVVSVGAASCRPAPKTGGRSRGSPVTSLTENLLTLVTAFLYHSPLTEGEFGKRCDRRQPVPCEAPRKGDAPAMDTADRALLFMGEPTIGVAFRSEVATFLLVTDTNGTECWGARLSEIIPS